MSSLKEAVNVQRACVGPG